MTDISADEADSLRYEIRKLRAEVARLQVHSSVLMREIERLRAEAVLLRREIALMRTLVVQDENARAAPEPKP
jgi:predicted RNase H-like nuclease (RuvC/YqgF family)